MAMFKTGVNGITRIDNPANGIKNNLPMGTVLKMEGYGNPRFVVVKNQGIDQKFGHGARYLCVGLEDGEFHIKDAFGIEHISQKKDGRIATYYTDEVVSPEECLDLYTKASTLRDINEHKKASSEKTKQSLLEKGRKSRRG